MSRDPERAGFLDAIRADPDSDAPRLIYADWLDENGEGERASLIRFQRADADTIRMPVARAAGLTGRQRLSARCFRGGFIDRFSVLGDETIRMLDRLWGSEALSHVEYHGRPKHFARLAESAAFCGAGRRSFGSEVLEPSPVAGRLRGRLACQALALTMDDAGSVPALSDGEFPEVRALDLSRGFARPDRVAQLLRLFPRKLIELSVCDMRGDPGLLLHSLDGLQALILKTSPGPRAYADGLLASLEAPGLRRLELQIGSDGWPADFAGSPSLAGLKSLRLQGFEMPPPDLGVLGRAAPSVRSLDVSDPAGVGLTREEWPALDELAIALPSDETADSLRDGGLLLRLSGLVLDRWAGEWVAGPMLAALANRSRLMSLAGHCHGRIRRAWEAYLRSEAARGLHSLKLVINSRAGVPAPLFDPSMLPEMRHLWLRGLVPGRDKARLVEAWGPRCNLLWEA